MRAVLFVSSLAVLATPSFAQDADAPVEEDGREVRKCVAPQVIVPTFNNTPEAMEQSRIAATMLAGDLVCKTSALNPELSELQHGPEEALLPDEEEAGEEAAAEPA